MKRWMPILLACCLFGCTENPTSVAEGESSECGRSGTPTDVPSGERVCVYRPEIVIETGFRCPLALTKQLDFRNFSVCSGKRQLPPMDLDFLHRHFDVPANEPWLAPVELPGALDILWVIDNTGTFCQEQEDIREGFSAFAEELAGEDIDFHVAITTTTMEENVRAEPVAKPGHIQSTPQPVPGFDDHCIRTIDGDGNVIQNDYSKARQMISRAVACMEDPSPADFQFSDAEFECVVSNGFPCELQARPECGDQCVLEDLFPDPSSYRDIPKVLRAADYRRPDGTIEMERLQADFNCASLVGTRGYGIEKGLEAAVTALGPDLTGGSVQEPISTSAPNHGFLRDRARLAVLFASDENDCSHDGSLDEGSVCGGYTCAFANSPEFEGPNPLVPVETMRDQLLASVSGSKDRQVAAGEIYIANFVGKSDRYTGPAYDSEDCRASEEPLVMEPVCSTASVSAYSGDRYDEFARSFPLSNVFPRADYEAPDTPLEGLICTPEGISTEMPSLAQFLSEAAN